MNMLLLLACAGAITNINTMLRNDGKMPVMADFEYEDDTHFTYQNKSEVNEWLTSDIIQIGGSIISYGDILIYLGTFFVLLIISIRLFFLFAKRNKKVIKKRKR
jgi:hypothetical protein